jgi:hypothetical protein
MAGFNRGIAVLLFLALLLLSVALAIDPIGVLDAAQAQLAGWSAALTTLYEANNVNFIIGQVAFGVGAALLFALLIWMEIASVRKRGVRIYTAEGGSAELDTSSIGRRLAWHLDQVAEVITVVPNVRSRGSAVDIRLEIEAAPDVDIPMKTEEVVQVTREVVEQELGLRMGRLDVQMRCAPFEPDWA